MDAEKFAQALRLFAAGINRMADAYHTLQAPNTGADQEEHTSAKKGAASPTLKLGAKTAFSPKPSTPPPPPVQPSPARSPQQQEQMVRFLTGQTQTPPPPMPVPSVMVDGKKAESVSQPTATVVVAMPVSPSPTPNPAPAKSVVAPSCPETKTESASIPQSDDVKVSREEALAILDTVDLDNGTASRDELKAVAMKLGVPFTAKRASELRVALMDYRDYCKNLVLPFPTPPGAVTKAVDPLAGIPPVAEPPKPMDPEELAYIEKRADVQTFIDLNAAFLQSQGFFNEAPTGDRDNPTYNELMADRELVEAAYEDNVAPLIASGEWATIVKRTQKGA